MNSLDRIKKAHISIMRHKTFCAFSGIVAMGKVEVSDTCPTAYTNGYDVTYGDKFVQGLSDPELRFVVMHEALHKAYRHLSVWKALWDQDRKRTNIAADHFVNLALADTDAGEGFITMPSIGIKPNPAYRGLSVRQIFALLEAEDDDPDGQDGQDGQAGDGSGFDDHGFGDASQASAEEQTKQAEEVQRALRQGESLARTRGKGKGSGSLMADILAPKIDWRQQLREFVQDTCRGSDEATWARPNRRFIGDDVYLPSTISETIGELAVIIDTSGSCFTGTVISAFASELAAIVDRVRPEKVRVLYVDDHLHGEQTFTDGQFNVTQLKVQGGGGTDLRIGFDHIRAQKYQPQAVIVFTDGYTPFPHSIQCPTLWVMTSSVTAPVGQTLRIEV